MSQPPEPDAGAAVPGIPVLAEPAAGSCAAPRPSAGRSAPLTVGAGAVQEVGAHRQGAERPHGDLGSPQT